MIEALLIGCLLLAFIGVVGKEYIARQLADRQQALNDAQREANRTAGERRQNEDFLAAEEDKERRLQAEYDGLADKLAKIRNR